MYLTRHTHRYKNVCILTHIYETSFNIRKQSKFIFLTVLLNSLPKIHQEAHLSTLPWTSFCLCVSYLRQI